MDDGCLSGKREEERQSLSNENLSENRLKINKDIRNLQRLSISSRSAFPGSKRDIWCIVP